MSRLSKPNTALEESRPFQGMSMVNENAAGVDIGAHEIMVCVRGSDHTQLVRSFGNYTADLYSIANWLGEQHIGTVATPAPTAGAVWKAPESIGYPCLKFWSLKISNVF